MSSYCIPSMFVWVRNQDPIKLDSKGEPSRAGEQYRQTTFRYSSSGEACGVTLVYIWLRRCFGLCRTWDVKRVGNVCEGQAFVILGPIQAFGGIRGKIPNSASSLRSHRGCTTEMKLLVEGARFPRQSPPRIQNRDMG